MANDTYTADANGKVFAGRFDSTALSLFAATLSVGQLAEMPTNGINAEDESGRKPNEGGVDDLMQDWSVGGVWDEANRIGAVAGAPNGQLSDGGYSSTLLLYDEKTNNWSCVRNPWGSAIGHCYDNNAIVNGIFYKMPYITTGNPPIFRYDIKNNQALSQIDGPPNNINGTQNSWGSIGALAYFPDMGVDGSFVHAAYTDDRVNRYDINTGVWTNLISAPNTGPINTVTPTCHYNQFSKKVIIGVGVQGESLTVLNSDGSYFLTDPCPVAVQFSSDSFLAAPNSNHSLLFDSSDLVIRPLNTVTGEWLTPIPLPEPLASVSKAISESVIFSIDRLGVMLILNYQFAASKQYIYKYEG